MDPKGGREEEQVLTMPLIHYLPDDRRIDANDGETILQAALRGGIVQAHLCGGRARCSTCRVIILEGLENCALRNAEEQAIADLLGFDPKVRLACQTVVRGDVKLRRLVLDDEDVELSSLFIKGIEPGLVGIEKHILILFADIVGFTSFAESLLPYDVIHVLNRYFHLVGAVIARHGGHIDTYMGDGFMALFEADDPTAGALGAIRAGLEMIEAVQKLGPYLKELYQRNFEIRLGLHYGQVVAGTLGAPGNKKMTVIGDAVNLASRIEAANKHAGSRFLISEDTYALIKGLVKIGRISRLSLPGKSGKYTLYEVIGIA
jgi:adenylate cyclase